MGKFMVSSPATTEEGNTSLTRISVVRARAVALAKVASLFLPSQMLERVTIQVALAGHVNTATAILAAGHGGMAPAAIGKEVCALRGSRVEFGRSRWPIWCGHLPS